MQQLKTLQKENALADSDLVDWIWQALMKTVDWTARSDQLDGSVVQHVTVRDPCCPRYKR